MTAGIKSALRGDRGARERLERLIGTQLGVTRVLPTDSGTSALTLAMRLAMDSSKSTRIALPGYCCYDLVTALNGAGAAVVFYDIDPLTLGPVWNSLEAVLALRPAAVVVAHLYGIPVDMGQIMALAGHHGVVVIEDAAQGLGAALDGRPLGAFGHLRVLSFGRGKGITAGRGGALLSGPEWRGPQSALPAPASRGVTELLPLLAQWILARPAVYRIPAGIPALKLGDTIYRDPSAPARMSQVAAAVAEVTWATGEPEVAVRRRHADRLMNALRDHTLMRPMTPVAGADSGWLRFPLLAPDLARDHPGMAGARSLGVMPGYPRSLDTLPALPRPEPMTELPGSRRLAQELWTLPTHSLLRESDVVALERWLRGWKTGS